MTEPAAPSEPSAVTAAQTSHGQNRGDPHLQRTLAWVGIVAGVVFTVAVVFFSGWALGLTSAGQPGWHRGYQGGQMPPGGCPMMGADGNQDMGPGTMRPGQRPAPPQR